MWAKRILKRPEGTAFTAAFLSGVTVHLYGLIIAPHNYDDIHAAPFGYGSGIPSGRFALTWLGEAANFFHCGYDLPVVNGLLLILLLSISVGFLISALSIRDKVYAGLIGALFVSFPTVTTILIHRFTAVYYGIGILLAVLAAWVTERNKWGWLCSVVCIAFSLGIYQAFIPITITIYVLLLIQQALSGNGELLSLLKRGIYDCITLVLGTGLYFFILKITLSATGAALVDYQGIDHMGQIALMDIPRIAWNAIYLTCMLPLRDYCGLTCTPFLKVCYLLLYAWIAAAVCDVLIVKIHRIGIAVFTALLGAAFLLAVNFVYIMCPDGSVYTLMVYAFALIACIPAIVDPYIPAPGGSCRRILRKFAPILLTALITGYAYTGNVNYSALYYCNRQVENYLNTLVAQVRMAEGFDTEKKWVLIGEFSDPLLWFDWKPGLTYGGFTDPENHLNSHALGGWLTNYLGYGPVIIQGEEAEMLARIPEVRQMPCWPNSGSIRVIGDTVVIKCEETAPKAASHRKTP